MLQDLLPSLCVLWLDDGGECEGDIQHLEETNHLSAAPVRVGRDGLVLVAARRGVLLQPRRVTASIDRRRRGYPRPRRRPGGFQSRDQAEPELRCRIRAKGLREDIDRGDIRVIGKRIASDCRHPTHRTYNRQPVLGRMTKSCSAVLEAAAREKKTEKAKGRKAKGKIGSSRSRSVEGGCYWQPSLARIAARLSPCDR